jgi:glycosyltransferase involved in cell wall biosynthesis
MIKVGVICNNFAIGGQEIGCLSVLRGLDRSSFLPYLYTFRGGRLLPEARALGIQIVVGDPRPGISYLVCADYPHLKVTPRNRRDGRLRTRFRKQMAESLRANKIDVCLIYAWRDGVDAAREANVPAMVERTDGVVLANKIHDKSPFDKVICESRTIRDLILAQREVLRCRRDQLVLIPNGVDLIRFNPDRYDRARCRKALGIGSDDFVIGTVARLAPEKNLAYLLRAVEVLVKTVGQRTPRIKIVIAGPDRGSKAELRAETKRLKIADRVKFIGPRSDVPEVLRAFDVFAITSITEGTPFAVLEAMAMGLPVVATPVGSVPEIIDGNGYLVSLLDPLDATSALIDLWEHPQLKIRYGNRSRRLAQKHDLNRTIRRYEDVLRAAARQG